jgi:hypothetical protein
MRSIMPMSRARNRNSRMNKGAIKTEVIPDDRRVFIELPQLRIQTKLWLTSFGGLTGMGSLDWLSCSVMTTNYSFGMGWASNA